MTTGHTISATTVKFILFSVVKKLENFRTKRPQNGLQITLRGAHSRQVESQKTSILGSVYVCTFIEVFVYVFFLLVYFFVLGVTQRHRIIQFGVYFFVFSCYTGTNVLSKTHFSFFHGSASKSRLTFARKFEKLRRNSNRKPRDAKNKQTNLGGANRHVFLCKLSKNQNKTWVTQVAAIFASLAEWDFTLFTKKKRKKKKRNKSLRKNKTQKDQSNPFVVI